MLSPSGLLARGFGLVLALLAAPLVSAQSQGLVVRDGSLGSGPLQVGPGNDPLGQPATYLITPELGEQRGSNLFHSFARFGVGSGETATFTGPDPIDGPQSVSHVIGRVTGGTPSDIDGTLRSTIPGADLWLFNPSGVIFGEGAQLDVRGSVHVSTGDHLGFAGTGERLHADRSRPSVLSTAPPEAFGFLAESGAAALSLDPGASLSVGAGEALELVAGDVFLTDARLAAPGADVRLEAQGTVGLERSTVDVSGAEPGTVSIRAGRLVVRGGADVMDDTQRSRVLAQNSSPLPGEPGVLGPGSISVDASESILVDNGQLSVSTSGAGNAGTISLRSPSITVQRGPEYMGVGADTVGTGSAGRIRIDADRLTVRNGAAVTANSVGTPEDLVRGNAGSVEVTAHSVEISDRSGIGAVAWQSIAEAGSIRIDLGVDGTLVVDAGAPDEDPSKYAFISSGFGRSSGTLDIRAGRIEVLDGGAIDNICWEACTTKRKDRSADSGVIRIAARELIVSGGWINATSWRGSSGDAGSIAIDADLVRLSHRGTIIAGTDGTGDAGEIAIRADSLEIEPEGLISVMHSYSGNGGSVMIEAGSVRIRGDATLPYDPTTRPPTGISAAGWPLGIPGDSGSITINAQSLFALEVGVLDVSTRGPGRAGSIRVEAGSVEIGQRGAISASSVLGGKAGPIDLIARDSIRISNEGGPRFVLGPVLERALGGGLVSLAGVYSGTVGGGDGGPIRLAAREIELTHGAGIGTSTINGGTAGDIELRADRIRISDGAFVDSSTLFPDSSTKYGRVVAIARPRDGNAGNVMLEARERIEIGGRHPVYGFSRVSSASQGHGRGGNLQLRAPQILIDGGVVATHAAASVDGPEGTGGGSIAIDADQLLVTHGGQVNASSFIAGPAGSIDVAAREWIRVTGAGSSIESRTGWTGLGGDVALRAPVIEIEDGGEVSARSQRGIGGFTYLADRIASEGAIELPPADTPVTGAAGNISLDASDAIRLDGGTIATNAEAANGGNVTIRAKRLLDLDHGMITASVTGGIGGNIAIDPDAVILRNGSRIEASAGEGAGGRIDISARSFFAFPGSGLSAEAGNPELSGTIEIHSPDVNLAGTLTALPISLLDAPSLLRERCAARTNGERVGSFVVRGPGGIPAEPDGWLRASLPTEPLGTTGPPAQLASPGPFLAPASCR